MTRTYSETLPENVRPLVAMIAARQGGNLFGTQRYGEEGGSIQWREAQLSPQTGLWKVREYRKNQDYLRRDENGDLKQGGALEQSTVLADACFFDALYACAEFEAGALGQEMKPLPAADETAPHFRDFAKAEGIVFDARNNMPIPVADGQVLIDNCVMDEDALQIARKSRGNLVPLKPANLPAVQTEIFTGKKTGNLPVAVNPDISAVAIAQSLDSKLDAHRTASKRTESVRAVRQYFKMAQAINYKKAGVVNVHGADGKYTQAFKICTGGAAALGASALAVPVLAPLLIPAVPLAVIGGVIGIAGLSGLGPSKFGTMIMETGYKKPEKHFMKSLAQVRRIAGTLPTEDMRMECMAAADHAEFGFRVLSARHAFIRALEAGSLKKPFARAAVKREVEKLVVKAKAFNIDERSIAALVEQIQNEPKSSYFDDRTAGSVRDQFDIIDRLFQKAGAQIAPQLPRPGR